MTPSLTAKQLYAQLYDLRVTDWAGEIDFYREFLSTTPESAHGLLEIACGTGRVTLQLAKAGYQMTGMDISPELLQVALEKSKNAKNPTWVEADMRTFNLNRKFGVVISPGHSFQFMNTPEDQVQCLVQIKRHLVTDGWLILHLDHQDVSWLASLLKQKEPDYAVGKIMVHPTTSRRYRFCYYSEYEPSSQTATVTAKWEEISSNGAILKTFYMEPSHLHCAFRMEIEHLLERCGFSVQAVYGDFLTNPLGDNSENMIWVARIK